MKSNLDTKFIYEIGKIHEPEIFLGVVRAMRIPLLKSLDTTPEAKTFDELLADLIDTFATLPRDRRRELYRIVHAANNAKES